MPKKNYSIKFYYVAFNYLQYLVNKLLLNEDLAKCMLLVSILILNYLVSSMCKFFRYICIIPTYFFSNTRSAHKDNQTQQNPISEKWWKQDNRNHQEKKKKLDITINNFDYKTLMFTRAKEQPNVGLS